MNVGELKNLLANIEDDVPVWMSKDEEGNAFRELYDVAYESIMDPEDAYADGLTFWEDDEDYDPADFGPAIVLWP